MTLRALVVCPETYGEATLPDLPGSVECAAAFVRWLLGFTEETCHVTVFADPQDASKDVLASLAAGTGEHKVDFGTSLALADEFAPGERKMTALGPEDTFVLYWLGHGAVGRADRRQWLYLPPGERVELGDMVRYMNGPGRPGRQLYVIDACREDDARAVGFDGRAARLFAEGAGVPRSDHVDQLELQATRLGDQAVFTGRGGVFSRRLVTELTAGAEGAWTSLDLGRVARTAERLKAEFDRDFHAREADSIPTIFFAARQGAPLLRGDYRLHVTVTEEQAEELRRILAAGDIGEVREGDVRFRLMQDGLLPADPGQPFPEFAAHVARLARPEGRQPYIVTLCAELAPNPEVGAEIRRWYGEVARRAHLPALASLTPLPQVSADGCVLVVLFDRAAEMTEDAPPFRGPEPEPYYTAQAWFYAGPLLQRVSPVTGAWPRDRLHEGFLRTFARALAGFGSVLYRARVEFIVENGLFDHDFHAFVPFEVEEGRAPVIGDTAPLVVRSRWRNAPGAQVLPWQERGPAMESVPAAALVWGTCAGPEDVPHTGAAEDSADTRSTGNAPAPTAPTVGQVFARKGADAVAGIVLSRPRSVAMGADDVASAVNSGAVLAIWPRADCHTDCPLREMGPPCHRLAFESRLRAELMRRPLQEIPEIMFELRQYMDAGAGTFRNVTVLFDDPRRSPLVQTAVTAPVEGEVR
ncbi:MULTISPECIES: hypothetical protein [unclassified Streptomyces]|uniref:hypothetical protein n=1 Tax=unclassified Streptomyces TaxID=2593676 RepID=UPI002E2BCAA0|nr:hypothetical protein [Streptomyces sp. NBC_00223]